MLRKSSAQRYVAQVAEDPILYVVANRSEAVFYADGSDRKFHFVERLTNKKGHRHESELVSDRPGRGVSSAGGGIHHGLEPGTSHHELAARRFAKRVAAALERGRSQKLFRELVLVAEPHFLGLLRRSLTSKTREAVTHEVGHEYYAQGSGEEVRARILKAIQKDS